MATFKLAKKDALSYTRTNIYDLHEKKLEYFDSEKEKLPEYNRTLKELKEKYFTTFGIRSIVFRSDSGLFINNQYVKVLGVCQHHDLGIIGAAMNTRALTRQLEILKSMGCNGIRTSHNPPAPELLDLCDKMGFVVMDEAFDVWNLEKMK